MPRKRRMSTSYLDEEDYSLDDKYSKDDGEVRAPRNAANARERARMRVLSKAFCRLKTTLPWVPADTKLSKLDTLRLAATYIAHLRAVLREDNDSHLDSTKPLSLTLSWPFAYQNNNSSSVIVNTNCTVSSTSETSHFNQYCLRSQHESNDGRYQNLSNRHNHEPHQIYY
ncbi:musculin [Microplitis demolitor]|uniref:musculin n=1 Tax=Microplitis demolitor TaxID=69319 RepID=UPI0004CD0B46|nr:musculin [Microplitis demolitor]